MAVKSAPRKKTKITVKPTPLKFKGEVVEKRPQAQDFYVVVALIGVLVAFFGILFLLGLNKFTPVDVTTPVEEETSELSLYEGAVFLQVEGKELSFEHQGNNFQFPLRDSYKVFKKGDSITESSVSNLAAGDLIDVYVKSGKVTTIYHD